MKKLTGAFLSLAFMSVAHAGGTLELGAEIWPPFVVEGEEMGTAEELVCGALQRSGWTCDVRTEQWDVVLEEARIGAIDGIVAAWRTGEREEFLLFSEPYITNRVIAVVSAANPVEIQSVADLTGRRVAMVTGYAYGDEIENLHGEFQVIHSSDSLSAVTAVGQGAADLALMDELAARNVLETYQLTSVVLSDTVLATRDLHFAVSQQNPRAEVIISDFERGYSAMLADGTVNEILNIDWLATEFGHRGQTDLVLRPGVSLDDINHPSQHGTVFSIGGSSHDFSDQQNVEDPRVNYQIEGKSHSTLQSALNSVFGTEIGCEHKEFSSEFDCTNLFKKK